MHDDGDVFVGTATAASVSPSPTEEVLTATTSIPFGDRTLFRGTAIEDIGSPLPRAERPRASESGGRHQIDGIDAQKYYSHTACVFVAK